jgi:hypothetical protein
MGPSSHETRKGVGKVLAVMLVEPTSKIGSGRHIVVAPELTTLLGNVVGADDQERRRPLSECERQEDAQRFEDRLYLHPLEL